MLTLKIDGQTIECSEGKTILEAADSAGIYIPRLCYHADLPAARETTWADYIFQGDKKIVGEKPGEKAGEDAHCSLCLVEINGNPEPVKSCITPVEDGMIVKTDTDKVIQNRQQALAGILADHPHACLTCAQKEGCSRTDCSTNVPENERCCKLLGHCHFEKVCDYIGIPGDTSKYIPKHLPVIKDDPLFDRDYNLCIGCLRCVRVCRDVRGVNAIGAVWKNGRSWVGTINGPGLKEAECRFCGACVEICPTGALTDKEGILAIKKDAPLPCVGNCPAGIDIPRYIKLIALGRYRDALNLIRFYVPFPGILGYVCFHPCEDVCRRKEIDQPVSICALKRFVADEVSIDDIQLPEKQPDTGKKIAVIGAGPTGLTAAYYLSIMGHQVELFDSTGKPGGMLSQGIPDYRLPEDAVERELESLNKLSIDFHLNSPISDNFGIPELKSQGFNAILVATGISESISLPVENSNLDGITLGLEFLKSAKLPYKPKLDGNVVVIGGGNVAVDAAMTAVRLGAKTVQLVCLESRDEMPAHDWEIRQAEEESIKINPSWGPKCFTGQKGKVAGVDLKRCTRVFDEHGRFSPEYNDEEMHHIQADHVIITIGQEIDSELLHHIVSLTGITGNILKVDENYALGIGDVFAAGDVIRGPSSVVEAIADGRKAADAIDKHLGGSGIDEIIYKFEELDGPKIDYTAESFVKSRHTAKISKPEKRKLGFGLIEETFKEEAATAEARRCLQCHLRQMITPDILPPEKWLPLKKETVDSITETEGVFQLLNSEKKVIQITGTANIKKDLSECLENPGDVVYFIYEEDPMYTKRESELIQQYLQEHGELPSGGELNDDLF